MLVVAKDFVFTHDTRVHFADELEIGIRGVSVPVDFVCHLGAIRTAGEELLNHDEVGSAD